MVASRFLLFFGNSGIQTSFKEKKGAAKFRRAPNNTFMN